VPQKLNIERPLHRRGRRYTRDRPGMGSTKSFRILVEGEGGVPLRSGDLVIARDRVIGKSNPKISPRINTDDTDQKKRTWAGSPR
jgi:hypothetical protein